MTSSYQKGKRGSRVFTVRVENCDVCPPSSTPKLMEFRPKVTYFNLSEEFGWGVSFLKKLHHNTNNISYLQNISYL